jgi:hypothetical protein
VGKVFISYSHDSPEHSARVLALSNALRAMGVDVELDRYHVRPPHGWPHWCEEQLRPDVSRFVLVVCTPVYRERVEGRARADEGRGVYWEGAILYNYLYNAKGNLRFIPVLSGDAPETGIPLPLDGHTRYRVGGFDLSDPGFEALYRELTGQPETSKPELGEIVKLAFPVIHVASPLRARPVESDFGTDGAAASRAGFWSPVSTEESVARGEMRFWAILETVAAMAVFWWTAIHYETFLLLFTSLFIAPLLLLRSEESTELGVKWIDEGMAPPTWPDDPEARKQVEAAMERRWNWIGGAIGVVIGLGLGYPAAKLYLVGHEGWSAFGRGLGFGLAMSWMAGAVAGAILVFYFLPGALLGLWLAALIVRVTATLRFARFGYLRLPINIRRLALYTAPLQMPELVPGLPAGHELRLNVLLKQQFTQLGTGGLDHRVMRVAFLAFAPFIYLPAWAYRFILKSTLWLWWILFIVGGAPRLDGGIEGLRADAYRKASARFGIAITIFAVVCFVFGWLFKPWAENLGAYAPLPAAVALLVLVDWKSVPIVQWVTLASASSTIAVVLWTHGLYIDSQNEKRSARVDAQLPWLGHLVKWKTGFGAVGIALLMLYVALYAGAVHHWLPASDWAADWLRRLYGAAATRLAPG